MRTRCTCFERWGLLLRVNKRFRGPNGDQHGLRSQKLDEGPSDLAARPIAPTRLPELEQEERLGSLQQEEPFAPPRRLGQPFLEVRQQQEGCAARRRRSPVAA